MMQPIHPATHVVFWSDPYDPFAAFAGDPVFFSSKAKAVQHRDQQNAAMNPNRQKWEAAELVVLPRKES